MNYRFLVSSFREIILGLKFQLTCYSSAIWVFFMTSSLNSFNLCCEFVSWQLILFNKVDPQLSRVIDRSSWKPGGFPIQMGTWQYIWTIALTDNSYEAILRRFPCELPHCTSENDQLDHYWDLVVSLATDRTCGLRWLMQLEVPGHAGEVSLIP